MPRCWQSITSLVDGRCAKWPTGLLMKTPTARSQCAEFAWIFLRIALRMRLDAKLWEGIEMNNVAVRIDHVAPITPARQTLFQVSIDQGLSRKAIYWFSFTDYELGRQVFEMLSEDLLGYMVQIAEVEADLSPATLANLEKMQGRTRQLVEGVAQLEGIPAGKAFLLAFAKWYEARGMAVEHVTALLSIVEDEPDDDDVFIPVTYPSSPAEVCQ